MMTEPVAWINAEEIGYMYVSKLNGSKDWKTNLGLVPEENDIPLFTAPPKKEWVGLTETEKELLWDEAVDGREHFCSQYGNFADAIEAKLKEKNT